MPASTMDHGGVEPSSYLIDKVGYIDDVDVPLNKVLLAIYVRPEKTSGGIYYTDATRDEDLYQGKACLVLKKGPIAFVDDDRVVFHGFRPEVGSWVVIRPSDGLKMDLNKTRCVLVTDTQVQMGIPAPDIVF